MLGINPTMLGINPAMLAVAFPHRRLVYNRLPNDMLLPENRPSGLGPSHKGIQTSQTIVKCTPY